MEDLVKKWQSGDEKAFDELFHQFKWLVFKNALIITCDREEAKDILQEVFIKVWKSCHTFNAEKGSFISWLYRITINQSISRYRKEKLHPILLDEESLDSLDMSHKELTENILDCKWEYEMLKELVDKMNDKHRIVLILRYFNDLTNNDIADILDIPVGTVKSRIHNALAILRRKINSVTRNSYEEHRKNL